LTQEDKGKEYVIAYLGRRLLDPETRYAHIEKLCLSLYYACSKMRHYLLSSTCVVACQADVIKHMLYQPILCGRIDKWAYALIEYDLTYEPLRALKGQVLADFIVEHGIELDNEINYLTFTPCKLYFDGSACKDGQGVGIVLISPSGAEFEMSSRLDFYCTNNQTEYQALLFGLIMLRSMGVKHVEAYGDSLLVVQQVAGEFQCLEGSLRACLDACLGIISSFAEFQIHHVSRHENQKANMLAQQASGYDVGGRNFHIQEQPIHEDLYFCRVSAEKSAKPTALVGLAYLDSLASQSAWPTLPVGLADSPMANLANVHNKLSNRPSKTSSDVGADLHDWRTPLLAYLRDSSAKVDKSVRRSAFKYCLRLGDVEDRSKPTHQRGPWTPKRSHKTCNAARDEA
jgi:ribonuclease HI